MGSTYVIGKLAAVCADTTGRLYWATAEKSYESNVFPHQPRWSVRCFGSYEQCVEDIINCASTVEGGLTKGTARTASAFITQWRKALASPVVLPRPRAELRFGQGFYDISEDHRERLTGLAQRFHSAVHIEQDTLAIDTASDEGMRFAAAATEPAEDGERLLTPWRIWSAASIERWAPAPAGHAVSTRVLHKVDLAGIHVLRLQSAPSGQDQDHLIVNRGQARNTGWAYSTLESFIRNEVRKAEKERPGVAEAMINAFRPLVDSPHEAPLGTRLLIRRPTEAWHLKKFAAIAVALGEDSRNTLDTTYGQLKAAGTVHELRYLPETFIDYQVEELELTEEG